MRLFVAINFTDEIKSSLLQYSSQLKEHSVKGNFTKEENLHLTLAFIGETEKYKEACEAVASVNTSPFELTLSGAGVFRRSGSDIRWVGIQKSEALILIQKQLTDSLSAWGFLLESRDFKPHITLVREVQLQKEPDFHFYDISMMVDHISLMKSEYTGGKLVYTEVYKRILR